jgi:hypothetical protein
LHVIKRVHSHGVRADVVADFAFDIRAFSGPKEGQHAGIGSAGLVCQKKAVPGEHGLNGLQITRGMCQGFLGWVPAEALQGCVLATFLRTMRAIRGRMGDGMPAKNW